MPNRQRDSTWKDLEMTSSWRATSFLQLQQLYSLGPTISAIAWHATSKGQDRELQQRQRKRLKQLNSARFIWTDNLTEAKAFIAKINSFFSFQNDDRISERNINYYRYIRSNSAIIIQLVLEMAEIRCQKQTKLIKTINCNIVEMNRHWTHRYFLRYLILHWSEHPTQPRHKQRETQILGFWPNLVIEMRWRGDDSYPDVFIWWPRRLFSAHYMKW